MLRIPEDIPSTLATIFFMFRPVNNVPVIPVGRPLFTGCFVSGQKQRWLTIHIIHTGFNLFRPVLIRLDGVYLLTGCFRPAGTKSYPDTL